MIKSKVGVHLIRNQERLVEGIATAQAKESPPRLMMRAALLTNTVGEEKEATAHRPVSCVIMAQININRSDMRKSVDRMLRGTNPRSLVDLGLVHVLMKDIEQSVRVRDQSLENPRVELGRILIDIQQSVRMTPQLTKGLLAIVVNQQPRSLQKPLIAIEEETGLVAEARSHIGRESVIANMMDDMEERSSEQHQGRENQRSVMRRPKDGKRSQGDVVLCESELIRPRGNLTANGLAQEQKLHDLSETRKGPEPLTVMLEDTKK